MNKHLAYGVVAFWGLLNGLSLSVLAIYGEASMVYWLWGGVVALLELVAFTVWLSSWRGSDQHANYRVTARTGAPALPAAIAVLLAGLSFAYGFWLLIVSLPLLAIALGMAAMPGLAGKDV
ncbi:hypothetical protein [Streptomyces montanisoli]|uniref:Uncharacterized protein n=1 Tax=Streptomyces montanisoli TaxID=2798581 RepID=A0A940M9J6_9ACTN|nr:hypothetical protein [Streptomyces montanisoli]MBP0456842.1 hypothetical protein [Streptomyces montanisoli]